MSEAASHSTRRSRGHHRQQPQQHPLSPPQNEYRSPPAPAEITCSTVHTVAHAQQQLGVSLTEGMRNAYAECEATVKRIAAQCRAKNRKFRDVEFDLENDQQRCMHNLSDNRAFGGAFDVRRVPEIFEKPVFYSGTPKSAEVTQGAAEDCYLVSALATMASVERTVKNLCVARDEEAGIYGFLFYRDCYWVPIIIDDLLYTKVPKWEQLSSDEKELYHFEEEKYNNQARKGSSSLYFSSSMSTMDGETWAPLVEKAYAKLHGDYASISCGRTCYALEDMTGGVSNVFLSKDVLDIDKFWDDELLKANEDRLFGCWYNTLDNRWRGVKSATVHGLIANLSYSIVKAVELDGKRFLVLRDPCGKVSWDGPWSDGSKEWTTEWLAKLPELGHSFGARGQFVMEYTDFLNLWQEIHRTLIFDDTWVMSSQWLHVSLPFHPIPTFSFGNISFNFSLPTRSPTIIVFTKYDTRYFKDISGPFRCNLDFVLAKEGETVPLAESSYSFFNAKGVSIEIDLEPGNYVVLARLDPVPYRAKDYFKKGLDNGWDRRKLARIMTERAKGQSIASNYTPSPELLPIPTESILRSQHVKNGTSTVDAVKAHVGYVKAGENVTVTTTTTTSQVISKTSHITPLNPHSRPSQNINAGPPQPANKYHSQPNGQAYMDSGWPRRPASPDISPPGSPQYGPYGLPGTPPPLDIQAEPMSPAIKLSEKVLEEDNSVVVGLKVYTKRTAPTVITGMLKNGNAAS